MNAIESQLEADLATALKARDEIRLQVLRLLKAALKNYSIEVKSDLSPQQVLQVLQKEAKKRQDSAAVYAEAGREDLAGRERAELEVMAEYLPAQASEADVRAAVERLKTARSLKGPAAMGQLIAAVREEFGGSVDGALVAKLAREALA